MGDSVRVELNLRGINELMSSDEVREYISEVAGNVAAAANDMSGGAGYGSSAKVTSRGWVAVGNVFPDSKEAAHDNYENNTIERAVGRIGLRRSKGGAR